MNNLLEDVMKNRIVFLQLLLVVALLSACQPGLTPGDGSTADPPLIPHAIADADTGVDCQVCHMSGSDGAPKNPEWHATQVDCRQCHVPVVSGVKPFKTQY